MLPILFLRFQPCPSKSLAFFFPLSALFLRILASEARRFFESIEPMLPARPRGFSVAVLCHFHSPREGRRVIRAPEPHARRLIMRYSSCSAGCSRADE